MVKSGVSRHVAQLEEHFGVRLFKRGARSLKLTPIGETLNQRIRSILAEVDLLEDIAREESGGVSGPVTIVTTPEFAGFLTSAILPVARARHPGLLFVVRPAYEYEDMQDPGVDLAFRIGSVVDDRLVAINLGEVQLCLVASPDIAKRHPLKSPEDIQGTPCLVFHGTQPDSAWTFVKEGASTHVDVSGAVAVRSFAVLLDLAIGGHGYAFLPHFMLKEALESGKLVSCLSGYRSRPYPVYMTFRPGARRVARIDAALSLAEELVLPMLRASEQPFKDLAQGA